MDVGFIGLASLGSAIALNLVKAGHRVVVYNRTRAKAEALASQGAEVAGSVAVRMPPPRADHQPAADHRGGRSRLFGYGRSAPGKARRSPAADQRGALRPVGGSPPKRVPTGCPRVRQARGGGGGELFVVAAGPEAELARCQPLFDAIGQRTFIVGDKPSAANLVKLSGNFLLAAMIELSAKPSRSSAGAELTRMLILKS